MKLKTTIIAIYLLSQQSGIIFLIKEICPK